MSCKLCQVRGKTWNGDNPKCAFESESFSKDNWNCATLNELRDIAEKNEMSFRHNDESIGVIPTGFGFIVMTWYKNRGQTGNALFMLDNEKEKSLTIKKAENTIDYWKKVRKHK